MYLPHINLEKILFPFNRVFTLHGGLLILPENLAHV
jgi:hypothetical protein